MKGAIGATFKLLRFACSIAAALAINACNDTNGNPPNVEVDITFAEPQATPLPQETAPEPFCHEGDTGFQSHSNMHGQPQSGYHGNMWRCHAEVKISLAIWGADNVIFGLASSQCPKLDIGPLDARYALPKISYDQHRMASDVAQARRFLESELRAFRQDCGLGATSTSAALAGFDELLETELAKAWIGRRYAQMIGDRMADEHLLKQAQEEYLRR